MSRPATAFVHGDGSVVLVPARVAAWLERQCDLHRVRVEARGVDAEVDAVMVALAIGAAAWRAKVDTDFGTNVAPTSVPAASSTAVITTSDAADRCGFKSPRPIVRAIAEGRLPASKLGGRWVIDVEVFADYLAARAAA